MPGKMANVGSAIAYLDLDTTGFTSKLQLAVGQLNAVGDSSLSLSDKIQSVGSGLVTMGSTLTKSVTVPIAAVGAMVVKTGSEFQQGMSQVRATMAITKDATVELSEEIENSGGIFQRFKDQLEKTDDGLYNTSDVLERLARQLGMETKFSALEAADAINVFAMAGYDVNEIIAATPEALYLASAGAMSIAEAADYATGILAGFNMEASQMPEITNRLAAMASNAKGDVSAFGEALAGVAGSANTYHQSIDDMATALAILGNHNVAASEAGNTLSRVMTRLYAPTDQAAAALDALNVSVYDLETGSARALPDVLRDLHDALSGLTEEDYAAVMKEIFGQVAMKQAPFLINDVTTAWNGLSDAINNSRGTVNMTRDEVVGLADDLMHNWKRLGQDGKKFSDEMKDYLHFEYELSDAAAEEVIKEFRQAMMDGAKTADEFADAIQNVGGAAKQMSDEQIDNLVGDIEILKSAFAELKISLFTDMDSPLRSFVQSLTELINKFNNLDNATKGMVVKIGAIAAAIGPVMMIIGKLMTILPMIGNIISAISPSLMIVVGAIGLLVAGFKNAYETSEEFRNRISLLIETFRGIGDTFIQLFNSIKETFRPVVESLIDASSQIVQAFMPIINDIFVVIADLISELVPMITEIANIISGVLIGAIDSLMPTIIEIINVIREVVNQIMPFIKELVLMISTFLVNAIQALIPLVTTIVNVLKEIISAILPVIIPLVESIMNVLQSLMPIVQGILDFILTLIDAIVSFLQPVLEAIVPVFEFLADILMLVAEGFNLLAEGITAVVQWFSELPEKIQEVKDKIVEFKDNIINGVATFFESLWNNLDPGLQNLLLSIWNFIIMMKDQIVQTVMTIVDSIIEIVSTIWEGISGILQMLWEDIVGVVTSIWEGISEVIETIWTGVTEFIENIWNHIKEFFSKILSLGPEQLGKLAATIINWGATRLQGIIKFLTDIINKFIQFFKDLFEKIRSKIAEITQIGKDFLNGFFDGLKSVWESIKSWVEGIVSWIEDKFNKAAEFVKGIFTFGDAAASAPVAGSHAAGLSYVPYNGYIAELHQGERVLTKEENERYDPDGDGGNSSGGDTFIFYGTKDDPYEYAKEIKRVKKDLAFN